MKLHGCWKHLVNQAILKVQKPLSIMDLNCQYVVWQFMDYFLVYHRAKQRATLRNGNMDHFTFIDRTPFEKVHLIFCKHLLGTKKTSSNIGVRAELGSVKSIIARNHG
jgi:hypothetical protein